MAKKVSKTPEVLDLVPAVPGDEQLAAAAWPAIRSFFGQLPAFFTKARELEKKAADTMVAAASLVMPTSAAEDVRIQTFIKNANAQAKEVEEHWSITSAVHGFHRKLTAARDRAYDPNKKAADLAQRLHNNYVQAEQRRVDEENRRRQAEAEERARKAREAELAEAERKATEAEAASENLSVREQRFVDLVHQGVVPSQAAHRAGYKDTTYGVRLMELKKIKAALEGKRTADALRRQAEAKKYEPLQVEDVEEAKPDVAKAAGATDRKTRRAEVTNAAALIAAVISGGYGIPLDVLCVDTVKLNEYARQYREQLRRWPGVKYVEDTTTV